MKVKDLIKILSKQDPEKRIIVFDWRTRTTDFKTGITKEAFPTIVGADYNAVFNVVDLKVGWINK